MFILANNHPMCTETEPIINVLNIQPWSIENNAAMAHMFNLPLPVTTAHPSIGMDNIVTSSVTVEPNLPIPDPQWPDDINPESLISKLGSTVTDEVTMLFIPIKGCAVVTGNGKLDMCADATIFSIDQG